MSATDNSDALFQLTGPLYLDDRYLGDIDLQVDMSGNGVVDAKRFLQLLQPLVSQQLYTAFATIAESNDFVTFQSLSVFGAQVSYDSSTLGVNVALPASQRGGKVLRLSGMQAPKPTSAAQPAPVAAGLRLSGQSSWVYGDIDSMQRDIGRAEGFITLGGFEGITIESAVNYNSTLTDKTDIEGWKLTKDFFSSATRLQAGEIPILGSGLQSSTTIQGFGVYRQYQEIRPFQNVRPTGRQSLLLEQPSTVDIYVNGTKLQSINLPPGPYDLDDFPLLDGFNDVQFRIRDASGNEEIIDKSVFYSPAILGDGVTDFGVWAGEPAYNDNSGNDFVSSAYLLRGFGLATVGGNMQVSTTGYQLGNSTVIAGRNGFLAFDLAWGQNRYTGQHGMSAAVNGHLNLSLRKEEDLRLDFRAERIGRTMFNPMAGNARNSQLWQTSLTGSWKYNRDTSFSFGATLQQRRRYDENDWSTNLGLTRRFGELSLSVNATHTERANRNSESSFRLSLTLPIGQDSRGASRYDSRSGRTELELSRLRRNETSDWSAQAVVGSDSLEHSADMEAAWYGQRFYSRVNHNSVEPNQSNSGRIHASSIQLSTTLGYADGSLGWGRSSPTGFTLVDIHPSLKETSPYVVQTGEVMFKHDGLGPALIPAPLAYIMSDQEVVIDDLPLGYSFANSVRRIMPGFVSGYKFAIGTDAHKSVTGILLTAANQPAALLMGKLIPQANDSPTVEFFSSTNGQFFAEGLAQGRYDIVIQDTVRGTIEIPDGEDTLIDLGRVLIHE
ncbi:fimbria/pilus outer membrane usher protein [Gilvimarinus sp. DA14]|uniref:fimbria/pilus outer membrane usher protein n=1 Tax=Gilvimarinus sp. DA14 TaxID=2956798 RepID=UPI0020B80611|nr:fimbria/pilus outer membrane usher protein [Gilvimarinus sp. DA14]UTF60850.1 fimbria/pilus outer membrane usher protein [Gilvimarinus sp. DA14]